jgi:hypothetical protein
MQQVNDGVPACRETVTYGLTKYGAERNVPFRLGSRKFSPRLVDSSQARTSLAQQKKSSKPKTERGCVGQKMGTGRGGRKVGGLEKGQRGEYVGGIAWGA